MELLCDRRLSSTFGLSSHLNFLSWKGHVNLQYIRCRTRNRKFHKTKVPYWYKVLKIIFNLLVHFLMTTCVWWVEHFGITSLLCLAMRSNNWFTRNDGGKAWTPPPGIVISSLQMGHRNCPVSLAYVATIRSKHCRHTVWEQGSSLGECSPPSKMPKKSNRFVYNFWE